ncbi:MAG: RNA polymerase factor sigma-54 [Bdellovibrionales bacterium]|nr:RNA polymerase factor sigma-54 [Bdellovibrionales bacterium]NQZ19820.1 RNA polymerase factor sigma-54 [Bdellovibrionales bacterium]
MAIHMKQSLALKQALRMTPQLQQAIKLLQLSRLELETAIRKELVENPVLEEGMELNNEDVKPESETPQQEADMQDPRKQDEFEWDSYFDNQQKTRETNFAGNNDEIMNYENVIASKETLHDHLTWQAQLYGFNEEELEQAHMIIEYINDDGYLKTPVENIANDEGVSVEELEGTLKLVQEFDPPGVGARDLKECLLIQAKHLQEDTHDFVHLITHHMHDLEKKNYPGIAKSMEITVEEVIDMCKIINTMEPKPGRIFATNDTHYVTPDVYVYKVAEEYMVSLNEDGLPKLRISNFYRNMLAQEDKSKEAKGDAQDYIQDKLRSAVWLIKSIHQRQRTIYKVAESIVKHQKEFFDKGPAFIKPMILRDIANDIEMHESTVSRVTTAKYMHTPQGIFELKYFFNSGISKTGGGSLASESVKLKIKDLVDNEDPKKPLSDQKIVDLLKKDGIQIARRTVAKYRDVLKILPSSKRKKYF